MCLPSLFRRLLGRPAAALMAASAGVFANPIVVGLGFETDDADSRSYTAFADVGLGDKTWLSGAVATTQTERQFFDVNNKLVDIALDHHFDPFGIRIGVGYWGDEDLLESNDLRGAVYLRGDRGSVSLDYQRRDFELTLPALLTDEPRTFGLEADGVGLSGSLSLSERVRIYASGMDFDYSRDIRLQPNVDRLRLFSLSRLSIINSLVDFKANAGIELSFGDRSLDLRVARWRTEVEQAEVDSIGLGFLTPIGSVADIELRIAFDDSESFGSATVFSFFLYLYDE